MSYYLSGTATTQVITAPSSTATNSFILRVQRLKGDLAGLKTLLRSFLTERSAAAAALPVCSDAKTCAALKAKLAQIEDAIALCKREITFASTPKAPSSTVAVEAPTATVNPNGTITPGPGSSVVTTPPVTPSGGAEPSDVVVSSGSIGTVAVVGGLVFLGYMMLRKRGRA